QDQQQHTGRRAQDDGSERLLEHLLELRIAARLDGDERAGQQGGEERDEDHRSVATTSRSRASAVSIGFGTRPGTPRADWPSVRRLQDACQRPVRWPNVAVVHVSRSITPASPLMATDRRQIHWYVACTATSGGGPLMKRIAAFLGISLMTAFPLTAAMAQQSSSSSGQPASGTPSAQQQPSSQQQMLVGSDSLVGSTVRNQEGQDIGKVSRLMIDPSDGRVASVIISTGGALGVGASTISVPWNSVKVGQDRGKVIVSTSQNLENA